MIKVTMDMTIKVTMDMKTWARTMTA